MHEELAAYHRLLTAAYRRYIDADLRLRMARQEMRGFFPATRMPHRGTIGAPGSPLRRLHDERDRALLRLQSSFDKYHAAKERVARRRQAKQTTVFFLSHHFD